MRRLYRFCNGLTVALPLVLGLAPAHAAEPALAGGPSTSGRFEHAGAVDSVASTSEGRPDKLILFPPGTGAPVRIRAAEDTLPETRVFEMPEIRVEEVRVPLLEIIRRAQAGERRKYEGIGTLAYTRTTKVTMSFGGKKPETRCLEESERIYFRSPDQWASAPLRSSKYKFGPDGVRKPWDEDDDDSFDIRVRDGRRLGDLPFYLDRLDKFNFKIIDREFDDRQVLYQIGFEPKSDFGNLPGGTMWLLTQGYQIVHEEFHLKNLPVPWILKSLGLLTREWQLVDGHWVERRITAKAELGMNFLGVPRAAEVVVLFDDYKFDPPLDAKLFRGGSR